MNEPRQHSVLFGVPMPEPGVLTAGQRWTAALAVLLAAALLLAPDGTEFLAAPADAAGTPVAEPPATGAEPGADTSPPPTTPLPEVSFPTAVEPLPLPPPVADRPAPTTGGGPAPEGDGEDTEPTRPEDGDDGPPDGPSEPCAIPVPALLANAGLCPTP